MSKINKILIGLLLISALVMFILIYDRFAPIDSCEEYQLSNETTVLVQVEEYNATTKLPTQEGDIIWICQETEL